MADLHPGAVVRVEWPGYFLHHKRVTVEAVDVLVDGLDRLGPLVAVRAPGAQSPVILPVSYIRADGAKLIYP